jgi:hypothetical protein
MIYFFFGYLIFDDYGIIKNICLEPRFSALALFATGATAEFRAEFRLEEAINTQCHLINDLNENEGTYQ